MNPKIKDFVIRQAASSFNSSLWFDDATNSFSIYLRAGKAGNYSGRTGFTKAVCISSITVEEPHQRSGVLTRFVKELIDLAKSYGYDQLQIENAWTPEMIAFCKKMGYEKKVNTAEGDADSYYLDLY